MMLSSRMEVELRVVTTGWQMISGLQWPNVASPVLGMASLPAANTVSLLTLTQ